MLTPKQEKFCRNIAILEMTQRQAYIDAYPTAKKWKPSTVDETACRLVNNNSKINARIKELMDEQKAIIQQEAKWTRNDAYKRLTRLIDTAEAEAEEKGELTSPVVSALINAVKELNTIYAVAEKTEGGGVLDDILHAVRGINND